MGAAESREPTEALMERCLTSGEQRLASKNFQLLATRAPDTSSPQGHCGHGHGHCHWQKMMWLKRQGEEMYGKGLRECRTRFVPRRRRLSRALPAA